MKTNDSIIKVKDKNKKTLIATAKKLIVRINESNLKHNHIAEAVQARDETFSRFMSLKPDYVTKRMCTDIDKFLTDNGY